MPEFQSFEPDCRVRLSTVPCSSYRECGVVRWFIFPLPYPDIFLDQLVKPVFIELKCMTVENSTAYG